MSLVSVQGGFGTNQKKSTLSDQVAAEISLETYTRNQDEIRVTINGEKTTYNVIETIENESTGLNGYVLENDETEEILISFEGTNKAIDWGENFDSFIVGGEDYTEPEKKEKYIGGPRQWSKIESGQAKVDENSEFLVEEKKNQFTEADKVVKTYTEKYGGKNITFVGHSLGGALAEYFAIKYNSNAVTFAAPEVYNILTEEQKKQADNGDFKSNIVSYTYSDDPISSYAHKSIGSTYYMADPKEDKFGITFENHGIANYVDDDMFDDEGYYNPNLLFDENLFGALEQSPLALKNSGISDFPIIIKAAIMAGFVTDIENNISRIENTEKGLENFWDFYSDKMKALKTEYESKVGMDEYDMLSSIDVEEVFEDLAKEQKGVPLIFNMNQFEELMELTKKLSSDTGEIAFHMDKMSNDFEETDTLLAQWLKF